MPKKPPKNKPNPTKAARNNANQAAAQEAARRRSWEDQLAELIPSLRQQFDPSDAIRLARSLYPDYAGTMLNPNQMRKQSRMDVNSIMAPQLAAIRKMYGNRSQDMADAYGGYTAMFADRLGGYADSMEKTQAAGVASQQGANEALSSFLLNQGNAGASAVGDAMNAIGAPQGTLDATAGSLQGLAAGSAGQTAALGATATDLMRGQAASANTWARKQPFRAEQQGREDLMTGQSQLNRQMGEDLDEMQSKIPELAYQVYNALLGNRNQQAQLKMGRASSILDYVQGAGTSDFNRQVGAAAIINNILGSVGSAEGTYVGTAAGFTPPPGGSGTSPGDKPPTFGEQQDLVSRKIKEDPFFQPGMTGDVAARKDPREAARRIAAEIQLQFPNWSPARKREVRNIILKRQGIPIPSGPKPPQISIPPSVRGEGPGKGSGVYRPPPAPKK